MNIFVAFGGVSPEHDISCITACQIIKAIDKTKYKVFPLYFAKNGKLYFEEKLTTIKGIKRFVPRKRNEVHFNFGDNNIHFYKSNKKIEVDCIIQAFHGGFGEAGGFNALFESCNIPSTGNVLGNAISMNKMVAKNLARSAGVKVVDDIDIHKAFNYPVIVKPSTLGSSIGISVAHNESELSEALELANCFTNDIIIEKYINNAVELNVSAIRKDGEIILSAIEKPKKINDFLSFEDKYLSKSKSKGMSSLLRELPANLPEDIESKVKNYAKKLYDELKLESVSRFDFIVDEENEVFFNEVNVIPGSFAYYLWEEIDINFLELTNYMIENAMTSYEKREKIIKNIDTRVL